MKRQLGNTDADHERTSNFKTMEMILSQIKHVRTEVPKQVSQGFPPPPGVARTQVCLHLLWSNPEGRIALINNCQALIAWPNFLLNHACLFPLCCPAVPSWYPPSSPFLPLISRIWVVMTTGDTLAFLQQSLSLPACFLGLHLIASTHRLPSDFLGLALRPRDCPSQTVGQEAGGLLPRFPCLWDVCH